MYLIRIEADGLICMCMLIQ